MREDFKKKVSQTMTTWTTEFYARYGFGVDVDPPPDSKPSPAKYALQKTDGVRPDMRSSEEQNRGLEARRKRLEDEQARVKAARKQAEAANNGPEVKRLDAELESLNRKWFALMDQIIASYSKDRDALRQLLMLKYRSEGIPDRDRFTVVFCRFRFTGPMQMRIPDGPKAYGLTYDKLSNLLVRFLPSVVLPFWDGGFAIIDTANAPRRSVAHEAVHGAGHNHPLGQYLESVEKIYHGRRLPGRTFELYHRRSLAPSYDDPAFDFDEVPHYAWFRGGYDDGPPDDLMNYTLHDPKPNEVNLRPAHVDLMNRAYFAK
ncbi:MAG TPA: hypothetical protein VJX91_04625 [Candidatus Eisenbacteria bacterium]|nr:hypothetical protein [Candidatus Eisenbacteria bacterium]